MCGFVGWLLLGCCDLRRVGVFVQRCVVPPQGASVLSPARCRGASRCVCCRRCRFVPPPFSCLDQVRRCVKGMGDRPRFRGFRPALCNEGTTERCLPRGFHVTIGGVMFGRVVGSL
jgi:hypothetical protein